jgi:hypothetical protein
MTIYVVANDTVDNSRESAHIVLALSTSSGGGNIGADEILSWFSSLAGIASLVFVALAVAALGLFASRRRKRDDDFLVRRHEPPIKRVVLPVFEAAPPQIYLEPEPEKQPVVPWAEPEQVRPSEVTMAEQEYYKQEPVEEAPVEEEASPSLIDAIPVIPLKPAEEYDEQYEQLLKDLEEIRETILHRQVGPSLVMEDRDGNMLDLDGLLKDERGPQFVSGLHLKKLMEKQEPNKPQDSDTV